MSEEEIVFTRRGNIGHVSVDVAIEEEDEGAVGVAQPDGMLEHGVEDLVEVERRSADRAQDLRYGFALSTLVADRARSCCALRLARHVGTITACPVPRLLESRRPSRGHSAGRECLLPNECVTLPEG